MTNNFKVAIVQETRSPYDNKWNTEKGLSIVKKAKERGADIVLFPECWITGYEFPRIDKNLTVEEIMKTPQFKEWNDLAIDETANIYKLFVACLKN